MNILGFISIIILTLTLIAAFVAYKKKKINFMYVLIIGVFLSILSMMLRIDYKPESHNLLSTFFLAIFHSIQIMLAGYEFDLIYIFFEESNIHSFFLFPYMPILFFIGPVCTFSFVISFFKNFMANLSYGANYHSDMYIFSAATEKSFALASSVRKKFPKAAIVFADKSIDADDSESAKKLNAIFLRKNITDIPLKFHSKKTKVSFFVLKEDTSENLEDSLHLIESFRNRANTELFVFSTSKESELLLDSVSFGKMKVRRINSIRSLAYSMIYNKPITEEFTVNSSCEKVISTLIIGFGGYGRELAKALLWCGQLPDFKLEINVVDKDLTAESQFRAECPEIIELNGNEDFGEARYNISFFGGVDVKSYEFQQIISKFKNTSVVYVSLGNDEQNIETAINMRILFERMGLYPKIRAIVYSDIRANTLTERNLVNYKNESYDIEIIGSRHERYSYDAIVDEELEQIALGCHLRWSDSPEAIEKDTKEFNEHEYFRNSSIATAIHERYRLKANMPSETAKVIEHMRWNAYMRTEGYIFSGSTDKSSRNDRAKLHHNLHKAELLNSEDAKKDERVLSINK